MACFCNSQMCNNPHEHKKCGKWEKQLLSDTTPISFTRCQNHDKLQTSATFMRKKSKRCNVYTWALIKFSDCVTVLIKITNIVHQIKLSYIRQWHIPPRASGDSLSKTLSSSRSNPFHQALFSVPIIKGTWISDLRGLHVPSLQILQIYLSYSRAYHFLQNSSSKLITETDPKPKPLSPTSVMDKHKE